MRISLLSRKTIDLAFIFIIVLSTDLASAQQSCRRLLADENLSAADLSAYASRLLEDIEHSAERLYKTSGFKNPKAFEKAIMEARGPEGELYRQAFEILSGESMDIGIRLPVKVRSGITKSGFLNSLESGTSQGTTFSRSAVEASYSDMSLQDWQGLPNSVKPKYAAAYPLPDSALTGPTSLNAYAGSDRYFFDMNKIRDRITITAGDSLNRFAYWRGSNLLNYEAPTSWDRLFLPWKHRTLMAPVLAAGLREGQLGLPALPKRSKFARPDEYGQQQPVVGVDTLKPFKMQWFPNMDYLEIQIWGPLTLDDVIRFEYTTSPPSDSLLRELNRRHIEIIDGRAK